MKKFQHTVTLNYAAASIRYETYKGKQYIVAPMVMLTEGVHSGSEGPLYYSRETLSKNPGVWNNKPIVVYHPGESSNYSAGDIDVLNTSQVGFILNAEYDTATNKLKAEAWLDPEELFRVDVEVYNAVLESRAVEVSTGMIAEAVVENGSWGTEDYVARVVNMDPDHLAILPDQRGACSLADGAGLMVVNSDSTNKLVADVKEQVTSQFGKSAKINTVLHNRVVYTVNNVTYEAPLTVEEDKSVSVGFDTHTEVLQFTEYVPLVRNTTKTTPITHKEEDMKKSELISSLIANEYSQFGEGDTEFLDTLNEEQLSKLVPTNIPTIVKNEEDDEEEDDAKPAPVAGDNLNLEQLLNSAEPKLKDFLASAINTHSQKRSALVTAVTNAEKNPWTKEELNDMPMSQLEKIHNMLPTSGKPEQTVEEMVQNYLGQAGAFPIQTGEVTEEPLVAPALSFD